MFFFEWVLIHARRNNYRQVVSAAVHKLSTPNLGPAINATISIREVFINPSNVCSRGNNPRPMDATAFGEI